MIALSSAASPQRLEASPGNRRARNTRLYWLCQLGGWGAVIGINYGLYANYARSPQPRLVVAQTAFYFLAGVLSCGLRELFSSLRGKLSARRFAAAVCLAVVAAAAIDALVTHYGTKFWLEPDRRPSLFPIFLQCGGMLAGWTAIYLAVGFYRGQREATLNRLQLEAARREAELRALKAQINPHFLFNSLNTLRALIPRELDRPRHAVTLLADLLREALNIDETNTVPLAHELATVDNYLALEQLRFESRLCVIREIDPAALDWPVPPFLLQGLVENAIKHGVAAREEGGQIVLRAAVRDATLHVSVTSPGQLRAPANGSGIGLGNARARLDHLFAGRAQLGLRQTSVDAVVAELTIPRLAADAAHP